jgi:hypothetical protein
MSKPNNEIVNYFKLFKGLTMKSSLLLLIASSLVVGQSALASSTVCSSENVYYSYVSNDYGQQPPPGTIVGSTTLVYKGKVLEHANIITRVFDSPKYSVSLTNETSIQSKGGPPSPVAESIYSATMTADTLASNKKHPEKAALINEAVICKSVSSIAP